jgi:pimeloyl-ACP methyl ester carboxylesterase
VIGRVCVLALCAVLCASAAQAQTPARVVDVPTRSGVAQRALVIAPENPRASAILFSGGHGGLQVAADGALGWGRGNFLIRSRDLFVGQGLAVVLIDAPSDRQQAPFLAGFRQTREHVTDVKAVIAWLRREMRVPVWLVGTSRGTQSAAFVATEISPDQGGPHGIVLTSSMLRDPRGRPVPDMPLERITAPVLVVHHKQDGCNLCAFADVPRLMTRLTKARDKELLAVDGGLDRGDPCEAFAYHGYNGLEREVVAKISAWITAR